MGGTKPFVLPHQYQSLIALMICQFANSVLEYTTKQKYHDVNMSYAEPISFRSVTEDEVFYIIRNIKSRAFGIAVINSFMLLLCYPILIPLLA